MRLFILFFANFISSVAMSISLIVVPWELANTTGGAKVLTFTATWVTALLIFLSPFAGRVVDTFSRRGVLMACVLIMGAALQITSFAYENPLLQVIGLSSFFFLSQIFFLFFYNALGAFVQEIFPEEDRGKVNGWMQVELQVSTLFVGLLMIAYLKAVNIQVLLSINSGLLLLSAFMLLLIPYNTRHRPAHSKIAKTVYLTILKRVDFIVLGLSSGAQFTCIMMFNLINPIYFNQVLGKDVSAIAMISVMWGSGAAISGFLVGRVVSEASALWIMRIGSALYCLTVLAICLYPRPYTIIALFGVLGFMGSGTGVAFRTYSMSMVDNAIFGSYQAVISATTYILRTLAAFLLTLIIARFPGGNHYWFVLGISALSFGMILIHGLCVSNRKLETTD